MKAYRDLWFKIFSKMFDMFDSTLTSHFYHSVSFSRTGVVFADLKCYRELEKSIMLPK